MLFGLIALAAAQPNASTKLLTEDIAKAWKLDFTGVSFDPNSWSADLKTKMIMIAALCTIAISYAFKMSHVLMIALFSFGLVKISWPLVGALATALYGWKFNKKIFLGLGVAGAYALAFGVSLF